MNVNSIIHISYTITFSRTIKPMAFNSEFGTLPVTFHMEVRKESILPDADMQSVICYTSIVHLRQSQKPTKFMKNKSPHIVQKFHSVMQV